MPDDMHLDLRPKKESIPPLYMDLGLLVLTFFTSTAAFCFGGLAMWMNARNNLWEASPEMIHVGAQLIPYLKERVHPAILYHQFEASKWLTAAIIFCYLMSVFFTATSLNQITLHRPSADSDDLKLDSTRWYLILALWTGACLGVAYLGASNGEEYLFSIPLFLGLFVIPWLSDEWSGPPKVVRKAGTGKKAQ